MIWLVGVTKGGKPASIRTWGINDIAFSNKSNCPNCFNWATIFVYIPPGIWAFFTSSFGSGKPKYSSMARQKISKSSSLSFRAASIASLKKRSISVGILSVKGLNGLGSCFAISKTDNSLRISNRWALIFAIASILISSSIPIFLQNTYTSSIAGAAVPPAKYQILVSTTSTPLTIAAKTEARPYPGVQWVWKSTGTLRCFLNKRTISALLPGGIRPLISLIVIISAPKASIWSALSKKYSFVKTGLCNGCPCKAATILSTAEWYGSIV